MAGIKFITRNKSKTLILKPIILAVRGDAMKRASRQALPASWADRELIDNFKMGIKRITRWASLK